MQVNFKESEVTLVDFYGNDKRAASAARVSFARDLGFEDPIDDKDKRLINFLVEEKHSSPFEHSGMTVRISCPLYIAMQILRHRTFSYNMVSRRYTSAEIEFHKVHFYRPQADKNLQCSKPEVHDRSDKWGDEVLKHTEAALKLYEDMIADGICREQARTVLPQNLMTTFWMTGNLWNWAKFLSLRTGDHVQLECYEVAKSIQDVLTECFPFSINAFKQAGLLK
jgi:thymidylate synthase (FAD)